MKKSISFVRFALFLLPLTLASCSQNTPLTEDVKGKDPSAPTGIEKQASTTCPAGGQVSLQPGVSNTGHSVSSAVTIRDGSTLFFGQYRDSAGNTGGYLQMRSGDLQKRSYGYAPQSGGMQEFTPFKSPYIAHTASTVDTTLHPRPVVVGSLQQGGEPYRSVHVMRFKDADFGGLDSSFGTNGVKVFNFGHQTGNHSELRDVMVEKTGKLVVVGSFYPSLSNPANKMIGVARLNTDGSLDVTFGGGGTGKTLFSNLGGSDDLKIVRDIEYGGQVILTTQNGSALLIRLDQNGNLAPTHDQINPNLHFYMGGKARATDLIPYDAGYLLAGSVNTTSGTQLALLKLDVNFHPTPFAETGKALLLIDTGTSGVEQGAILNVLPGNRVLLSGHTKGTNPSIYHVLVKPGGTLETGFGQGGIQVSTPGLPDLRVTDVSVQSQVYVTGSLWWQQVTAENRIVSVVGHGSASNTETASLFCSTHGFRLQ